jgi:hypothetical protein
LTHNTGKQRGPLQHIVEKEQKIKLFKDSQTKITFRTQNTIQNIIKQYPRTNKYNKIGIYQIKCLDCTLEHVGQTGGTFHNRYKEQIHAIRYNNSNSGFSSYILNTGHTYGTITDTVAILGTHRKKKTLKHIRKIPHT